MKFGRFVGTLLLGTVAMLGLGLLGSAALEALLGPSPLYAEEPRPPTQYLERINLEPNVRAYRIDKLGCWVVVTERSGYAAGKTAAIACP